MTHDDPYAVFGAENDLRRFSGRRQMQLLHGGVLGRLALTLLGGDVASELDPV